jgi:hypothetical protein
VSHVPRTQVLGQIPAEWLTFVRVTVTQPFTVPLDRRFVVTLAETSGSAFMINGVEPANAGLDPLSTSYTYDRNGARVAFQPGTVLSVGAAGANLWGYLEPVR